MRDNILELAIVHLLRKEPYYGNLLIQFRRVADEKIKTAGVAVQNGGITLYYNPVFLDAVNKRHGMEKVAGILKHEAQHITHRHITSGRHNGKYKKMWNLATDCSINQINDLLHTGNKQDTLKEAIQDVFGPAPMGKDGKPMTDSDGNPVEYGLITLDSMKKMAKKPNLKDHETADYYYQFILDQAKKNGQKQKGKGQKGQGDPNGGSGEEGDEEYDEMYGEGHGGNHDTWERSDASEEVVDQICRNAIEKSANKTGRGNCPSDVLMVLKDLEKDRVNWKALLRNFVANNIDMLIESDRRRRNRRYGIKVPGIRKELTLNLVVCNDTSGSVPDEALQAVYTELKKMSKQNVKIKVIDADAEVAQVYDFNPRKPFNIKGRGGTTFSPALVKAESLAPDAIIYFTDGYGEGEKNIYRPKGVPVLWGVYTKEGMQYLPKEHRKILIEV